MRVFQPRKHRVARSVLHIVVFILIMWLAYSKLSEHASGESSFGGLKGDKRISGGNEAPKLADGLGNFEPPREPSNTGPGENGKRHELRPEQENDAKASIAKYGMNMVCSDEISFDRTIPDLRHEECRRWNYFKDLPRASVIVVFHNEGFSTLMRTVHSVLNRSPPQLLEEIILVDDYSDYDDMKDKLESYIQRWGSKVRLIRNKEREGLINTRSRGAREAHGEIIVFLDAHCEVNKNWLPPLLAPIFNNRTTMTAPIIDSINKDNFEIHPVYPKDTNFKGIFEWGLLYKETPLSDRDIIATRHHTDPYRSPTHAGGLFAINRQYFLQLGTYDPGLLGWGGENFELSFKVWQCGGNLLWVPCSRVAHVYKGGKVNFHFGNLRNKRRGDLVLGNYRRIVETWMDDKYKEYFYTRQPSAMYADMGDISEQLELKEKLQCKSFQWFMDTVAYDVTVSYPEPPPNVRWGAMKNVATKSCLDPTIWTSVVVTNCYGHENQLVRLNEHGQLGFDEQCIDVESNVIKKLNCEDRTVDGPWQYNKTTTLMYHTLNKKCMAVNLKQPRDLSLQSCDPKDPYQHWVFIEIRP